MPYSSSDIPSGTSRVPKHGQEIYRKTFNAAVEKYGEARAHAIAWASVKRRYRRKKPGGKWTAKDQGDLPGHPFRGNQYTSIVGAALEALAPLAEAGHPAGGGQALRSIRQSPGYAALASRASAFVKERGAIAVVRSAITTAAGGAYEFTKHNAAEIIAGTIAAMIPAFGSGSTKAIAAAATAHLISQAAHKLGVTPEKAQPALARAGRALLSYGKSGGRALARYGTTPGPSFGLAVAATPYPSVGDAAHPDVIAALEKLVAHLEKPQATKDYREDQPRGASAPGHSGGEFASYGRAGGISGSRETVSRGFGAGIEAISGGVGEGEEQIGAQTGGRTEPPGGAKASAGVPDSLVQAIEDHVIGMAGEVGKHGAADLSEWLMRTHRKEILALADATKDDFMLLHKGDLKVGMPTVWLLMWNKNYATSIHDHLESEVGVSVLRGSVGNRIYESPRGYFEQSQKAEGLEARSGENIVRRNQTVQLKSPYIHQMFGTSEPGAKRDVTVHAYAPPLSQMHYFQKDSKGRLHYAGDWDESRTPENLVVREKIGDAWRFIGCPCCMPLRDAEWSEEAHPRGKTGPGTTPGSFAPASGGAGKGEGNGKAEHPGAGYSKEANVDAKGVIHTDNVDDAVKALAEGRKVELAQKDEVATLLDKLGKVSADMIEKGAKAPNFNLCDVSVKGTNLFCAESFISKREEMPQLPEDVSGFVRYLRKSGYEIMPDEELASHLRATQSELKGSQVAGMAHFIETGINKEGKLDPEGRRKLMERPILISREGYVLDGHHNWAANIGVAARKGDLEAGMKMNVLRVNTSITNLLYLGEDYTGGKGHKGVKDWKLFFRSGRADLLIS